MAMRFEVGGEGSDAISLDQWHAVTDWLQSAPGLS